MLVENLSGQELAYADGNSPGWSWNGAANNSTSKGPAIYESITNPALSRWRTAIADRSTAPAKMLVIGDSISEGQGASTRANRWLSKSHDAIRTKYPTTGVAIGGENYVPSLYIVGAPDSPWQSFSGNQGSPTPSNVNGSLGYRTVFLDGTDGLFYNVTGTDVDIWWCGGGGTFAYQIDGGSVVNINTTGAYHTDYRTSVSLGASGPHTIGIAAVSGTCGFNGFTVYDGDKTKGIQYYDSCRSGAKSGDFLIEGGELVKAIQTVAPQLVIVELGGNDALQSIPVATFQSNLNSIVGGILGSVYPVPSVLLVGLYSVNQALLPGGIVWADYKAAIAAIAASDPTRIAYLDLTTGGMPTTDTSGAGYYRADGLHPNNSGHIKIAELVNGMIS
jgi:lysophospholipase L1-like esterase